MEQGIDPRTGNPVGEPVPETAEPDVRAAVERGRKAVPWLAELGYARRAELLRAMASTLRGRESELVELADAETALGAQRLTGELARTAAQLDMFAAVLEDGAFCEATIETPNPQAVPAHTDLRRMLMPLGPVAVFAASNFPFAFSVVGGDTASALAAGCPVLLKAHPGHPGLSVRTAEVVAEALESFGAPAGVLELVYGLEAGRALVTDPSITAVGFTGSARAGKALFELAANRPDPIPFYGELSSVNPVVLTPAAVAARSAEIANGLAASFTLGSGQFCTKPGLVFTPADAGFSTALADVIGETDLGPMLTSRLKQDYQEGVTARLDIPGVRDILAAQRSPAGGHEVRPAVLAVDAAVFREHAEALAEECFGPVTLLVEYRDTAELDELLRTVPGSLTGSVHAETDDPDAPIALAALRERVGRIIANGWPTGVAVTWSQHHGGPWPATTAPLHTSVGATAIRRFLRPVTYQDVPQSLLPPELRADNPLGIPRRVNGVPEDSRT